MDTYAFKLRFITVLVGMAIALIFAFVVAGVLVYLYGITVTSSLIYMLLIIMLFIDMAQWLLSPYLVGLTFKLKKAGESEYPELFDIVREACNYNNIHKIPEIYVALNGSPNAFAYGSPLTGKRIAFTKSILNTLNHDELLAVTGHEIGHIRHHDMELLMAIGLIPTLIFYMAYGTLFSSFGSRKSGNFLLIAVLLFALSFVFNIMILGVNRIRESYADVNSAKTVPGGAYNLQRSLAKLTKNTQNYGRNKKRSINDMLMFSDNNFKTDFFDDIDDTIEKLKAMKAPRSLFSDHPHPAKRIQNLEKYKNNF